MKVLGIGESVVDSVVLSDNHTAGEKHVGGPILIGLTLLSRLGIDCTLVTTLGRDADAAIIKRLLKHERVHLLSKIQHKTKVNTIMVNGQTGERKKVRGTVSHRNIKDLSRDFIRQFDLILIDRHEPLAFYEILKKKKDSAKILIDPSTEVSAFTLDMIKYADYPILPIEALTRIQGAKDIRECLERLYALCRKTMIVTAGDLGSLIYDGRSVKLIPALHVKAVDTNGAGDVYRGGFAYGIIQGWDLARCAEYANCVAAIQCTRLGNAAAIPTKEEIELCNNFFLAKKSVTLPTITDYFLKL